MSLRFLSIVLALFFCYSELFSQNSIRNDSTNILADSSAFIKSSFCIDKLQSRVVPMYAGESDVFKLLHFMPGVSGNNEFANELSVHGFEPGNKLVLVEGIPINNFSHNYRSMPFFQSEVIKTAEFYKSNFPARFGNKLFSAIDISFKDGDFKNYSAVAEANPINAKFTFDGPIIKEKLSIVFSANYNYSSILGFWNDYKNTYGLNYDKNFPSDKNSYGDLLSKVTFKLNKKNRFTYLISNNPENSEFQDRYKIKTLDQLHKLQWQHLSDKLFFVSSISYTSHQYSLSEKFEDTETIYIFENKTQECIVKSDLTYNYNNGNSVKTGVSFLYNRIIPFKLSIEDFNSSVFFTNSIQSDKKLITSAFYIEDNRILGNFFVLNYGFRYSIFSAVGEDSVRIYHNNILDERRYLYSKHYSKWENIKTYQNIEPRLSLQYNLDDKNTIDVAYSRSSQYVHNIYSIENQQIEDFLYPSSTYFKPELADHISIEYKHLFSGKSYEIVLQPYFAHVQNLIKTKDHAILLGNVDMETEFVSGVQNSYGVEFNLKKNEGILSGWISYTLSKSLMKFDNINQNEEFPSSFQPLHNLAVVIFYRINDKWVVSSNFKYSSGNYITSAVGKFYTDSHQVIIYSSRNSRQLPDSYRTDVSATYIHKFDANSSKLEISAGIYNLFDNPNYNGYYYKKLMPNESNNYKSFQEIKKSYYSFSPYFKLRFAF